MSKVIIGVKHWPLSEFSEIFVDGIKVGELDDFGTSSGSKVLEVLGELIEAANIDNIKVERLPIL